MATWRVRITARVLVVEREAKVIDRLPSTFISGVIYGRCRLSGLCCLL
jgi:hypothetical protein